MNIGQFARKCILENPQAKNADIVKMVRAWKPEAKTTEACIAWYKSDMKKKGTATSTVEIKRTTATVEDEIIQVRMKLESLEEELAEMKAKDEMELLEQEEELMAKLEAIRVAKAKREEQPQE